MPTFAQRLIQWQRCHGRHDLPWQGTSDPYRVWLSEIMLQQTQVTTVIPYYARFLSRLPTLASLAAAPLAEVMALWSGLGYYARARNLHRCACVVMDAHGGAFPATPAALAALPGIGRSTANAIAAFCFGAAVPILNGNVKRLLCRCFGVDGYPGKPEIDRALWQLAAHELPAAQVATYLQAQMDMGAMVCTRSRPRCEVCPVADICIARREQRIAELPTAKARTRLPVVNLVLLVIRQGNRVLLETRPAQGIWGGLRSLPELSEGGDPAEACYHRFGLTISAVSPAPTFQHTLTHRILRIHPLICEALPGGEIPAAAWLPLGEQAGAALPTPVRRILNELGESGVCGKKNLNGNP